MRRIYVTIVAIIALILIAITPTSTQVVITPGPVPTCNVGDTLVVNGSSQWVCGASTLALPVSDASAQIANSVSPTKLLRLLASAITAGNTRTVTFPDANLDLSPTTANYVLATGSAGAGPATFRALVSADIPNIDGSKITGAGSIPAARVATGTFSGTTATSFGGTVSSVGNFDVNTSKFTVNATSGNTVVAGTLNVTGLTTLSGGVKDWTPITITTTGTVNDWAPTGVSGNTVIYCNNATDLTITGIANGYDGQLIQLITTGTGNLILKNQNTNSTTAGDRLINIAGVDTPVAGGGHALYQYQAGTVNRWRLIDHEQGVALSFTPVLQFGGGTTGITYSTQVALYYLRGRQVFFQVRIILTNKGSSTGAATIAGLPYAASASTATGGFFASYAANFTGLGAVVSGYVGPSASSLSLYTNTSTGSGGLTDAHFTNGSDVDIMGSYFLG